MSHRLLPSLQKANQLQHFIDTVMADIKDKNAGLQLEVIRAGANELAISPERKELERKLLRRIDLRLMPMMMLIC